MLQDGCRACHSDMRLQSASSDMYITTGHILRLQFSCKLLCLCSLSRPLFLAGTASTLSQCSDKHADEIVHGPCKADCALPHHHSCPCIQMIQHKENPDLCSFFIFYRWGEQLQTTLSILLT